MNIASPKPASHRLGHLSFTALFTLLVALTVCLCSKSTVLAGEATRRPNVVLILADDMEYTHATTPVKSAEMAMFYGFLGRFQSR